MTVAPSFCAGAHRDLHALVRPDPHDETARIVERGIAGRRGVARCHHDDGAGLGHVVLQDLLVRHAGRAAGGDDVGHREDGLLHRRGRIERRNEARTCGAARRRSCSARRPRCRRRPLVARPGQHGAERRVVGVARVDPCSGFTMLRATTFRMKPRRPCGRPRQARRLFPRPRSSGEFVRGRTFDCAAPGGRHESSTGRVRRTSGASFAGTSGASTRGGRAAHPMR